jgi:hypothetical protein
MAAIEGSPFGRVMIDGREQARDVLVLPDRVVRRLVASRRSPAPARGSWRGA